MDSKTLEGRSFAFSCGLPRKRRFGLPGNMPTIVVEIAADRFRRQGVGTAEAAQRVSSLSDNGQSVSFQAYAAESVPSSGLTESEMQALCAYRKLW